MSGTFDDLEGGSETPPSRVRGGGRRVTEETFDFEGWSISVTKGTILPSKCYCSKFGEESSGSESDSSTSSATTLSMVSSTTSSTSGENHNAKQCHVCKFSEAFGSKHLPEMVFPDNVLRLTYPQTGFTLEFNAIGGISMISDDISDPVHIACSKSWKASKAEEGLPNEEITPYDWTFSTTYKGTLGGSPQVTLDPPERINLEKLKIREEILFYDELTLYEDELHDCGISNLGIKIRVMPSGYFLLLRFFLRVDSVRARVTDTRIYFEKGHPYLLRETQVKELSLSESTLESHVTNDPNLLAQVLPVVGETRERIHFQ